VNCFKCRSDNLEGMQIRYDLPRTLAGLLRQNVALGSNQMTNLPPKAAGVNVPPANSNTPHFVAAPERGQQRHLTVLFCNLVGLGGIRGSAERSNPEVRVPRFPEAWIPQARASITRCARVFSPRSNANC
jgi:hypothetical protein